MDQATRTEQTNSEQRQARVRKFIYSEMRTPVATLKSNAEVRSTQWEPIAELPQQTRWLGDMATAGVNG